MHSLHTAVGLRSTSADEALLGARAGDCTGKGFGTKLTAVVGAHGLQLPASCGKVIGDSTDQCRAVLGVGVDLADLDATPDEGAGNVDGGVLPGSAPRPAQPADVEAVDLNQIAGLLNVEVQRFVLRRRLALRLGGVAGDQPEALDAGSQAVAAQNLEHAAGRDHDTTPHRHPKLGCDSAWTQAGMPQGEADDSLLNPGRQLIGHPGRPALSGPQQLEALLFHHRLPAVVPGAVIAELSTGSTDADLRSPGEQAQAMAEKQIIISHGGTSSWA